MQRYSPSSSRANACRNKIFLVIGRSPRFNHKTNRFSRAKEEKKQNCLPESFRRVHQINKGYALVIYNRYFSNFPPREGSEKDLEAIKVFYNEAGFKLDILENVKVNEIRAHCRKLKQDETRFQNYDGFVCFILSHGNR